LLCQCDELLGEKMPKQKNISIGKFKLSDLDVIKKLIHHTIDMCYSNAYPREAIKFFKDWHCDDRILKQSKEGYTIVLEKNNQIIGTGTIVDNHIMRVFVEPAFQKQGFGKLIMRKLEEKAVSLGIDVVILDASLPSKKFYDLLGYKTLEKTFIPVENGERLDFYKMEKILTNK
jgi:GNAT superfamily N-acetyltransferase